MVRVLCLCASASASGLSFASSTGDAGSMSIGSMQNASTNMADKATTQVHAALLAVDHPAARTQCRRMLRSGPAESR